jgi:hypothetical protein
MSKLFVNLQKLVTITPASLEEEAVAPKTTTTTLSSLVVVTAEEEARARARV